jgi:hypothetical protein
MNFFSFVFTVGSDGVLHAGTGRIQGVGAVLVLKIGSWLARVLRLLSGPARSMLMG